MEQNIVQEYKQVDSQVLDTTADCIKFCPFQEYNSYFLIAFYQLNEELQQSFGGMRVYHQNNDKMEEIQRVETAGVLDFQWLSEKIDNKIFFAAAQCDSTISIYQFDPQDNKQMIKLVQTLKLEEEKKFLYIDLVLKNNVVYLIASTDIESVHIYELSADKKFSVLKEESISKNEFSVWACAVSRNNPEYLYLSGGDDSKLRLLDTRLPTKIAQLNKNSHMQGITTINFSPHDDNIFVTGSYDETVRIFDIRNIKEEVFSSKKAGGVWRTIFDKNNKNNLLCGVYCQKYFEIIDYNDQGKTIQKLEGHDSLAYSCDYKSDSQYIVTCSFYDKQMNMWKL